MDGVNAYPFGTTIILAADLTDRAGQPVAAGSIRVCVWRPGNAAETELEVSVAGNRAFASWTPPIAGYWHWRAWTEGPPAVARERLLEVEPSQLGADPA